jgi:pSer/pThr/pTyr-binding forkhead associated (FHA) protein
MSAYSLVVKIMSGPDDGQKLYLDQDHGDGYISPDGSWSLVLGRREESDVSIPFDTQVSRQHAMLRVTPDGELWLVDAGSLNGTFVEKCRVERPQSVQRGHLIRLGRTWLRIEREAGEE